MYQTQNPRHQKGNNYLHASDALTEQKFPDKILIKGKKKQLPQSIYLTRRNSTSFHNILQYSLTERCTDKTLK
jgi:hypothetical protein